MTYEIIFDSEAEDFLSKCQKDTRRRIFEKIVSAKDNPFRFFERLEGRADFKMRVGDYRVIADISSALRRIEVTRIGYRKKIYERA